MKHPSLGQRTARVAMVLGLLTTSLVATASAAQIRYRYDQPGYRYERRSNVGPILGGFVGGILLGTLLANASHGQVAAQYAYEDPYTERCYPSYDAYLDACRYERHPAIVRVIDVRTGSCVRTSRYEGGRWVDARWEDRGYGYGAPAPYYGNRWDGPRYSPGYDDRGYDDRGYGDRGYGDRGYGDCSYRDHGRRTWQRERHRDRDDDRWQRGDGDDDD